MELNNPLDALRASGLNPIVIDDADDLGEQLGHLLRKRETNTEFITRVMEFGCPTGALIQPFIMYALEYYCAAVAATDKEALDNGLFSGQAWKATGEWLAKEVGQHYTKG